MYFGSIRFFKHLILFFIFLMIVVPIAIAISLGIKNASYKEAIYALEHKNNIAAESDKQIRYISSSESEAIEYQLIYPELYSDYDGQKACVVADKTMYLTFDDGPSEKTSKVLDILKEYNIKATFFVVGRTDEKSKDLMRRIVNEGHQIGVHSYSHVYNKIYSSVSAYLDDFYKMYQLIYETTGVKPQIFRFPGGSINSYNTGIYQEIIAEMNRRGFVFYDWNISSGDANSKASEMSIKQSVLTNIEKYSRGIILMHDASTKSTTVAALPSIIEGLKNKGYNFGVLTPDVKPMIFNYTN